MLQESLSRNFASKKLHNTFQRERFYQQKYETRNDEKKNSALREKLKKNKILFMLFLKRKKRRKN